MNTTIYDKIITYYLNKKDIMWFESNSSNEIIWQKQKPEENSGSLTIQEQAKNYMDQANTPEEKARIQKLLSKQQTEIQNVTDNLIIEKEKLINKEKLISWAKTVIYDALWINENINSNSVLENFSKWFIDEMVLWNADMAIEIINTWGKILIDAISSMFTWNWLKQMAISLWESIWKLLSGDSYSKWKSIAELWLITTWVWVASVIWKIS